ncbi:hypothetical protein OH76DRAFT_359616 [Lentinus brumalis]|uniref:C2H2-type domain-containing protein n=1 Tax=Lentinus brumalis TaxID=2498619 RepID=A0A371CJ99_9APHY|nr:hypothetical protein OH76DRAFT_359616 [Polyporus brumalis]
MLPSSPWECRPLRRTSPPPSDPLKAAPFAAPVSDGPPRLGFDSCGPAEEDASKKRQTPQEKKHKCTLCPRAFARSYNLRVHISRGHDGERPFPCHVDRCPREHRGYTRQYELDRHYKRKHPGVPPRKVKGGMAEGRCSPVWDIRKDA